jgi:hypothetical protein
MSKTELNVFFKMQQKDDKKEILKFEIKGNDGENSADGLYPLAGSIIIFNIQDCKAGDTTAEFMNIQRDSKKTALKFAIKGDSEDKAQELYKFAGRNVKLSVQASQISIEEFYEEDEHEGLPYTVDKDGIASISPDQMSLDDVPEEIEEEFDGALIGEGDDDDPFAGSDDDLLN